MDRFYHSRGRIFVEVVGALAVAASFVAAWMQTGAWAMLPAAFVAAIHGILRWSDLGRHAVAAPTVAGQPAVIDDAGTANSAVTAASKRGRGGAKAPRKAGSGRSSARKAKPTEIAPPDEPEVKEMAAATPVMIAVPTPPEEVAHAPHAPLFEPDPFVRQQRAVFGRKAG